MPTYTPIQSIELTAATSSVTFSNIPQIYQDLVVVCSVTASSGGYAKLTFNNDTAGNYSTTLLEGDGTSAYSYRFSNTSWIYTAGGNSLNYGANQSPTLMNISVQNYANSTTNKTALCRSNVQASSTLASTYAYVGLWRNTSAINRIDIAPSAGNWNSGSTFDLYGISPVAADTAQAFGGTEVFYDSSYVYHVFKGSGTFTPYRNLTADVLVVAGGGGSGADRGGGGGAGGLLAHTSQSLTSGTSYTVTVGAGGVGGTGVSEGSSSNTRGSNGSNSQFGSLTASVGGGGGGACSSGSNLNGQNGGSGGGAGFASGSSGTAGSLTSSQGNNGGTGIDSGGAAGGGGGGGASAAGANATSSPKTGGAGGAGSSAYSSWGSATGTGQNVSGTYWFAGGGGGGGDGRLSTSAGAGGNGGGGAGNNSGLGTAGTTNTGGGAGGPNVAASGSSGGSGLVIVRYAR